METLFKQLQIFAIVFYLLFHHEICQQILLTFESIDFGKFKLKMKIGTNLLLLSIVVIMNGMSCLLNDPYEFQNILSDIINPHFQFVIVCIDDVLVFSDSLEKHFVHLKKFFNVIKANGMACSTPKMKLFQTRIFCTSVSL